MEAQTAMEMMTRPDRWTQTECWDSEKLCGFNGLSNIRVPLKLDFPVPTGCVWIYEKCIRTCGHLKCKHTEKSKEEHR